ncbi:MAG TPA: hypothetical protein VMW88_03250 [Thermoplasmata archaeon]|jgi:hypothetical protein|nr:hypothetical protein [Thermoplasmata archaeon]
MPGTDKEILEELDRLREDVKQLREVVNVLINVVMEEDLDDEDEQEYPGYLSSEKRFGIYN